MPAWLVIGGVTLVVALAGILIRPRDVSWFANLRTPDWLTFEWAIPFIWTTIFTCGALSAYGVWQQEPGSSHTWLLMGVYLLLEMVTVAYIPVMLWLRSLKVGLFLGSSGLAIALFLVGLVWPVSGWASLLLVPYLLWSPIGTFTTWQMIQLNPDAA